jgi:hypothetical protein
MESKTIKLQRNNTINTLNIKKNIENLYRFKNVYCSKINLNITEKNVCLNSNLFFTTDKLIRYKRNLFSKKPLVNLNKKISITKLFKNKNVTIKTKILNKLIDKNYAIFLLNNVKKFNNSLFSKRYTQFFDLIKIATLTSMHKENVQLFSKILASIFRSLPKKKHNLFVSFLKHLLNLLIVKNTKNLKGMKIVLNGKLQGKTRAKTIKIQTGPVSINSIKEKPVSSKIHIYTLYGAYGLQILANYK